MKKMVFIVGGARSGKSSHAVNLAKSGGQKVIFLATCTFYDDEMKERIKRHQGSRPASWEVITEGQKIGDVLEKFSSPTTTILVDCLGMWVANLMEFHPQDESLEAEFEKFTRAITEAQGLVIVVSNEVGCGVVPPTAMGRRFRDLLGRLNQIMAQVADEVILMQLGIPTKLKGKRTDQ
ncbi:MAG: bifunctional adenosylcobinamide kinase/adenosylcobinamide-phosphate guanylyltransferase [Candidatus Omnitrophica bacterium]|nr:bifunctional adenosylcobinamide kinase/adenosylcobinamide-phosphate guanylyltransferase [Candidatus Omnitrophota bacterium]